MFFNTLFLSEIPVNIKKFLVDDVEVPERLINHLINNN